MFLFKLLFKNTASQFIKNYSKLTSCPASTMSAQDIKYLSQEEAISLDKELFEQYSFNVEQLMELAGLSVATAIASSYPNTEFKRPVIFCGPGNNGGDGLVCARHLKMFGYSPVVIYPKQGRGKLFLNLETQCRNFDIDVHRSVVDPSDLNCDLIVDAVFGFSFKPPNRNADFAKMLSYIHACSKNLPLVSVDIPSGWSVESGHAKLESDQRDICPELKIPALKPHCLVSLTAPKQCAKYFVGKYHYLGGRFCPPSLQSKYLLNLPPYHKTDCVQLLKT